MKKIDKRRFYVQSILYVLGLIAAWAVFNLFRIGFEQILLKFGIVSEALQMVLIIVFVGAIFILLGYGFRKTFDKVTGRC